MPARRYKDFERALKQGKMEAVYLLFGAETYLRDEAARAISEQALRGTLLREFNESSFSLASGDARSAIASAEQLPMMSEWRVVRLNDFARLDERSEEALLGYLARPAPATILIFIADDIDKRRRLTRALLSGAAFEFAPLGHGELLAWAKRYLKNLKTEIDQPTLVRVIELVGNEVRALAGELDKLSAAALPSRQITMEMVQALVSRSRELSNFDLTDQLITGEYRRALETLEHLLDDGAEPLMLIGLIASNFRRLALAKELSERGATAGEVFRHVWVPYEKRRRFLTTLDRLDTNALARHIKRIAEADLAIKTSKATPRMQVEMLVCELIV
jgi:DNA polymerase-3 subunit delta